MKKETSMHDKNCIKVSHIPTGSGIFSVLTPQVTQSVGYSLLQNNYMLTFFKRQGELW